MLTKRVGMIGAGRMATALARGFIDAGLVEPQSLLAADPSDAARQAFSEAVPGATVSDDSRQVASAADVLVLAVKPQQIADALAQIADALPAETLVVSIAAGVTLERLAEGLGPRTRIVRVMPNTPCLVGRGASAYSLGKWADDDDGRLVHELLSAVGSAHQVDQSQLDAVTGLSGSGPAFVYTVIEALAAGGTEVGLPAELAARLATETVAGAAAMVLQTGEAPTVLRERVKSPGGTTVAGLEVIERGGLRQVLVDAVRAATERSRELGRG